MSQRRAGIIYFKINGQMQDAKGNFSYNLGHPKREAIVGADGTHGFKEVPQAAYIEGDITDRKDLDLAALVNLTEETVTLELANGKVISLPNAWYAAEGTVETEEANIKVRFEAKRGKEIK